MVSIKSMEYLTLKRLCYIIIMLISILVKTNDILPQSMILDHLTTIFNSAYLFN